MDCSPPAFPGFILPGPPKRAEHVSPQYPSADVLHGALREVIVHTGFPVAVSEHRPESFGFEEPFVQIQAADALWVF